MKVVVTGANGMLGTDVVSLFQKNCDVVGLGRKELDITDLDQCIEIIDKRQPDVIIHCAAYTAVDLAESEEDLAYSVNAYGTRNLSVAAERIGCKICYISTDYVFDGTSSTPYREYDHTNPINVYGKSKRAGEILVQSLSTKHFIVRTSWLYGLHGNNFVKTMLRLAEKNQPIRVVDDQFGSPTFTEDLAKFLVQLVSTEKYGVYHASNSGSCSWYEFAKAIFEERGINVELIPCSTEEFPRPAPRPRYTVMADLGIRVNGFDGLRGWHEYFDVAEPPFR
jgi:dTDP-4-dehydrorhamnose reductase